jgi:hypothetical protein
VRIAELDKQERFCHARPGIANTTHGTRDAGDVGSASRLDRLARRSLTGAV